jgi:hypothetical protein
MWNGNNKTKKRGETVLKTDDGYSTILLIADSPTPSSLPPPSIAYCSGASDSLAQEGGKKKWRCLGELTVRLMNNTSAIDGSIREGLPRTLQIFKFCIWKYELQCKTWCHVLSLSLLRQAKEMCVRFLAETKRFVSRLFSATQTLLSPYIVYASGIQPLFRVPQDVISLQICTPKAAGV